MPTDDNVRRCGTKTRAGTPCQQPAGAGTDHVGWGKCRYHGGNSPNLKIAASREETAELVAQLRLGQPMIVDPAEALVGEVYRSAGVVAFLDGLMGDVGKDDLIYMTEAGYKPRAFVDVWTQQRAHLAKVCSMALAAGVAERQVRIAERQGELVAGALNKILGELGLTTEQRAIAPGIVRKHLMSIAQEAS